ncbi:MAG: glycosyltransferase [Candidatus Jordarchaeaceae archaeon]
MCKASVIIITKELNSRIDETLKSLLSQNFKDYEILIVCHKNSLKELPMASVPIKVIEQPDTSRGMARNIGAANSSGEVIAFIDDDCASDEEWLQSGFKTLSESEEIGIVGGRVKAHEKLPKFSQIALNIISVPFINGWSVTFSNFKTKREVSYVPTCSAFFKKDVLEKAGGFVDTNYCEDVEICSRVRRLGYKIVYDPKVEVRHKWSIWNWHSFIKHFYNYGKGRGRAMIEYPHIGKVNISPLVALMLLLIFIPLVVLEPRLLLFILVSFEGFTVFCSFYTYHKFRKKEYLIFTPLLMVLMYLSYTIGLLAGVVGWRRK